MSTLNINVFSVLYSAIGQFKKQFDYLEENPGKSGPVILPERKHESLPRLVLISDLYIYFLALKNMPNLLKLFSVPLKQPVWLVCVV